MAKGSAIDNDVQQNNPDRCNHIIVYLDRSFSCGVSHPHFERAHTGSGRYGDTRRCSNHYGRTQAAQKTIRTISQLFGIRATG